MSVDQRVTDTLPDRLLYLKEIEDLDDDLPDDVKVYPRSTRTSSDGVRASIIDFSIDRSDTYHVVGFDSEGTSWETIVKVSDDGIDDDEIDAAVDEWQAERNADES